MYAISPPACMTHSLGCQRFHKKEWAASNKKNAQPLEGMVAVGHVMKDAEKELDLGRTTESRTHRIRGTIVWALCYTWRNGKDNALCFVQFPVRSYTACSQRTRGQYPPRVDRSSPTGIQNDKLRFPPSYKSGKLQIQLPAFINLTLGNFGPTRFCAAI
jgi:hypothetical protein